MEKSAPSPSAVSTQRASAEPARVSTTSDFGTSLDASPRVASQRAAIEAVHQSPPMLAQQKRATSLQDNGNVLQGAFIIAGAPVAGAALDTWIDTYVAKPEVAAQVRAWAGDAAVTTNHANDLAALAAAQSEATDKMNSQNSTVAHAIDPAATGAVAWATVPVWGEWYFSGLQYQDNKTGGWHRNQAGLLPGAATAEGIPTRYVEFRRPGAIGKKEDDKLERCIFDLLSGRCWPNAHYDGGYVEITGVPAAIRASLLQTAFVATGMQARQALMSLAERAAQPVGPQRRQWLITRMAAEKIAADAAAAAALAAGH